MTVRLNQYRKRSRLAGALEQVDGATQWKLRRMLYNQMAVRGVINVHPLVICGMGSEDNSLVNIGTNRRVNSAV